MSKRSADTSSPAADTVAKQSHPKRCHYEVSGPGQFWEKLRPYLSKASKEQVEGLAEDLLCELWKYSGQIPALAVVAPFWKSVKEGKETITLPLESREYVGPPPSQLRQRAGSSNAQLPQAVPPPPSDGDPSTPIPKVVSSLVTLKDHEMLEVIEDKKRSGKWPLKRHKAKRFTDEPLNTLRRYKSTVIQHRPVLRGPAPGGRSCCALCSTTGSGLRTRHECSVCNVALCVSVLPGEPEWNNTHFKKWHNALDLEQETKLCSQQRQEHLKKIKEENAEAKDATDDEDKDATDDEGFADEDI